MGVLVRQLERYAHASSFTDPSLGRQPVTAQARIATLRHLLAGMEGVLRDLSDHQKLEISPAYRHILQVIARKVSILASAKAYTTAEPMAEAVKLTLAEVSERFEIERATKQPGALARLMGRDLTQKPGYDAALAETVNIYQRSLKGLARAGKPATMQNSAMVELLEYLERAGMELPNDGQPHSIRRFWLGVGEMVSEIGRMVAWTEYGASALFSNKSAAATAFVETAKIAFKFREAPEGLPEKAVVPLELIHRLAPTVVCQRLLMGENLSPTKQ